MARTAHPWYWKERSGWFVIVNGQRQFLGDHPPHSHPPRKKNGKWVLPESIRTAFHTLMVTPAKAPPPPTTSAEDDGTSVAEVIEKYLAWCQQERAPRTYEWYTNHLQSFVETLPDPKTFPVDSLKPHHVDSWVKSHPTWGAMHRRGGISAVQRAFSWAEKMGHLLKSPIRYIEKPAPKRREQVLTPTDFQTLLAQVKDHYFRDLLEFQWETGARPQETRIIEARHANFDRGRIEIPPAEAKGKKRWRFIYLTQRAEEIVRRLSLKHPDGPIFRNRNGQPWKADAFNCRFCRMKSKLGVKYAHLNSPQLCHTASGKWHGSSQRQRLARSCGRDDAGEGLPAPWPEERLPADRTTQSFKC